MRFCNMCGKEVADTATLCPVCGASIVPVQTPTTQTPAQQFVPQQYPIQSAQPQYPTQSVPQQYPVQQAQPQYNPQPIQQQYTVQQHYPTQPTYQHPVQPAPVSKAAKIFGLVSFIFGLVSIAICVASISYCYLLYSVHSIILLFVIGISFNFASFLYAFIGLILSVNSKKKGTVNKAKIGMILSIIGLIFTIINCYLLGVFLRVW